MGQSAGAAVTTGVQNTLIGGAAGDALTDADENVAIGFNTLTTDVLGSKSTAVGRGALAIQNFTTATDSHNTAVGYYAGVNNGAGISNSFIGSQSGQASTGGNYNVAVGHLALATDKIGHNSTAIGYFALANQNNTTSTNAYNTAVGSQAGGAITTGLYNTLVGALAGDATDDGAENTAVGYSSLSNGNCGNGNSSLGAASLFACTGANNTAVGVSAGSQITSGSNLNAFGKDAALTGSPGGAATTGSNAIYLGDENITAIYAAVSSISTSDERDKTDFTGLNLGLDFVKALAPVTYKWDKRSKYGDKYAEDYDLNAQVPDGTHKEDWLDIGFKAQEVIALEEAAGYKISDKTNLVSSFTDDETQYGLKYDRFVPILVKAIQDQDAIIQSLTARIAALES